VQKPSGYERYEIARDAGGAATVLRFRSHSDHAAHAAAQERDLRDGRRHVIDGTGRPPIADGVVIVGDGRIADVGPRASVTIPPGVPSVEAAGNTLVPGLWDMHTHVTQIEWAPVYPAAGVTTI